LSPEDHSPSSFSVEHIVPKSEDGATELGNLALSCQGCNNHKFTATAAVDPTSGRPARLYHPRQDRWVDHFTWNADQVELIGISITGRATISRLRLNRKNLINLRSSLRLLKKFPVQP
jgi:hypothetical protein